jgi:hypothetical protein
MASLDPLYVELSFSPTIELIVIVREFVTSFYERALVDADTTSRVAVATHELLENACKYSLDGATNLRIELGSDRATVRIRLRNRASPEHIANLQERFALMRDCPDPTEYYQRMMVACVHRNEGSGLGLARIRAEAELELALETEGDVLTLHAETASSRHPAHAPSPPVA